MTLYLKYRPKTLEELDLTSVREALKKIASGGNLPHAVLFSGPKGLGKTSAARILAKIANCENLAKGEPCNKCHSCLAIDKGSHMDVVEIDAASHRGIDDIRIIREAVKLAPSQGKKKIYIIDEAHMLTTEASNALLKTLEEPPEHVVFILATTNPEKLIETIRSRALNISFSRPSSDETTRALTRVAKNEGLDIKPNQLADIVERSAGSFRDAVKIMEAIHVQKINLPVLNFQEVENFIKNIFEKNLENSLSILGSTLESGIEVELFGGKVLAILREMMAEEIRKKPVGRSEKLDDIISLIKVFQKSLSQIAISPIEELPLEIAVVEWCMKDKERADQKTENGSGKAKDVSQKTKKIEVSIEREPKKVDGKQNTEKAGQIKAKKAELEENAKLEGNEWSKIVAVASRNKSIESLLKNARLMSFDGQTLTVGVYYSFHKERLESQPHRQMMDDIVKEVFGKNIRVVCSHVSVPKDMNELNVLTESHAGDIIDVAKEVFGN